MSLEKVGSCKVYVHTVFVILEILIIQAGSVTSTVTYYHVDLPVYIVVWIPCSQLSC